MATRPSGWDDIVDWFGFSPSFHDAEVLSIELRRAPEPSFLRIHAWRMTDQVDERGFFVLDRHAVVTLTIRRIAHLQLTGWSQNVLSEMTIEPTEAGWVVLLEDTFGVGGRIEAEEVVVSVSPGRPTSDPA